MITFATKQYEGKTVGFALSHTPLEIRGTWHIQGRQPIGGNGAPQWVLDVLEQNPGIQTIAVGDATGGAVYSR